MNEATVDRGGRFNVISWNMLVDKTRQRKGLILPQHVRLAAHIATLQAFEGSLDVVGIQEAVREEGIHCGVALAKSLGFTDSYFYKHNKPPFLAPKKGRRGRRNEFIGVFGERVHEATPIYIGDRRVAVKTMIGSTAVVNFHLRQGLENRPVRIEQVGNILDAVADYDQVALIGDTNENWSSPARQAMYAEGFESAFLAKHGELPMTYPTPEYHEVMYSDQSGNLKPPVSIDDICIRGLTVVNCGILEQASLEPPVQHDDTTVTYLHAPHTPSDHGVPWATLEPIAA